MVMVLEMKKMKRSDRPEYVACPVVGKASEINPLWKGTFPECVCPRVLPDLYVFVYVCLCA